MLPQGYTRSAPRDRADDERLMAGTLTKPPVLSRATQRLLALLCLGVIVYGTLGPLRNAPDAPWLTTAARFDWVPPQDRSDLNDVLTNFFVYVPVGIAFRLLVRRRRQSRFVDLVFAMLLSVGLSYATEVLQQLMPARSANLTDVYINAAGAFTGALIAVPLQWLLRWLHMAVFHYIHIRHGAWIIVSWLAVALAFVLMTMPWEPKRPAWVLGFDRPLAEADPLRYGRFAAFAGVAFLLAGKALVRGVERRAAVLVTLVKIAAFVSLLELAQLVIRSHVANPVHVVVALVGALGGALLAAAVFKPGAAPIPAPLPADPAPAKPQRAAPPPPRRLPEMPSGMRYLLLALMLATLAFVVGDALMRGNAPLALRSDPVFEWIPFQGHFHTSFERMAADVLQQCVLYGMLTLVCLLLTVGGQRAVALFLLLGLVGLIEVSQAFIEGHGADTTTPLLAVLMWFVVTRIWNAIYPPPTPNVAAHHPAPNSAQLRHL